MLQTTLDEIANDKAVQESLKTLVTRTINGVENGRQAYWLEEAGRAVVQAILNARTRQLAVKKKRSKP